MRAAVHFLNERKSRRRMSSPARTKPPLVIPSVHGIGVVCGLAAGVWLGAAEAPTKLVNSGLSPYAISLCMVAGVFTARWTVPTLLKGTRQVFADLAEHSHLIPVAILAGMLWAVANTLTVFAIRDVGLAIAFPLWNTNSLVGILWGRLLFGELEGSQPRQHRQGRPRSPRHRNRRRDARLQHDSGKRRARRPLQSAAFSLPLVPACFGERCIFPIARPTSAA